MIKQWMKILLSTLLLFFMQSLYADSAEHDLMTRLNGVQTMRADFTQVIMDNKGKMIQQSYGSMALERPGKFRWEVKKPIPQLIIANGSRLWIYDKDLEQVTIRTLKGAAGETPALLLSQVNTTLSQDYIIKLTSQTKTTSWYTLIPKKSDNFESIQMQFAQHELREMRLADRLGHTTRIQFKKIELNVSLSQALFHLTIPKNVDVINEARIN